MFLELIASSNGILRKAYCTEYLEAAYMYDLSDECIQYLLHSRFYLGIKSFT